MSEHIYPITAPAGCPSYLVRSVQDQCNSALRRALSGESAQHLEWARDAKRRDELTTLRMVVDGKIEADWGVKWGCRTVTRAWEDAAHLARFRDALADPNLSHVTSGHPVSPNTYHAYVRDPASPSGCHLAASAGHDLPGVDEVLRASGRTTCQGAQRGEMAARRAMMDR